MKPPNFLSGFSIENPKSIFKMARNPNPKVQGIPLPDFGDDFEEEPLNKKTPVFRLPNMNSSQIPASPATPASCPDENDQFLFSLTTGSISAPIRPASSRSTYSEGHSHSTLAPTVHRRKLYSYLVDSNSCPYGKIIILDCRYEYEYQGGRIIGAINVTSFATMIRIFQQYRLESERGELAYKQGKMEGARNKRVCVIIHCEFSHDRGPQLFQKFRAYDRHVNPYPKLSYPNVFLLEEGYKEFHKDYPDLCVGGYVSMRDSKYVNNREIKRCTSSYFNDVQARLLKPFSVNGGIRHFPNSCSQQFFRSLSTPIDSFDVPIDMNLSLNLNVELGSQSQYQLSDSFTSDSNNLFDKDNQFS